MGSLKKQHLGRVRIWWWSAFHPAPARTLRAPKSIRNKTQTILKIIIINTHLKKQEPNRSESLQNDWKQILYREHFFCMWINRNAECAPRSHCSILQSKQRIKAKNGRKKKTCIPGFNSATRISRVGKKVKKHNKNQSSVSCVYMPPFLTSELWELRAHSRLYWHTQRERQQPITEQNTPNLPHTPSPSSASFIFISLSLSPSAELTLSDVLCYPQNFRFFIPSTSFTGIFFWRGKKIRPLLTWQGFPREIYQLKQTE